MHRLAAIHNVTDDDRQTYRRNSVPIARPLVRSAKNENTKADDQYTLRPVRVQFRERQPWGPEAATSWRKRFVELFGFSGLGSPTGSVL